MRWIQEFKFQKCNMTKSANDELLQIQNLTLSIGDKTLLHDVSFDIKRGENIALVGESGSGKSLTALSIMQLLPMNAAIGYHSRIIFKGNDLLNYTEVELQKIRGNKICIIFQEPMTALNPVMTIGHQIDEVIACHHLLKGNHIKAKTIELLREVEIAQPEDRYSEYPHQLSGGMRQRVMIAMAIASRPDLLIADEATSALDVTTQAHLLKLLSKMQKKYNMAILFITHDMAIAKYIADKIVQIEAGKIIKIQNKDDYIIRQEHYIERDVTSSKKIVLNTNKLCIYFPIQKGILKRTTGYIKAVQDVTINLYEQETLALVGESGSGKSTLAKGLAQLIKIYSGYINYAGKDPNKLTSKELRELHHYIQIVFQDPFSSLNPRMTVFDIIGEGLKTLKLVKNKQQQERKVLNLLEQVKLPADAIYRYPHEFSGGQRQRIVIARALAVKPKIIICDEPTSALDHNSQEQIINLLIDLQNKFGLSYLFITHNMQLAAAIADKIAIMKSGKIIEQGKTKEVLENPQMKYTKTLIDSTL